MSETLFEIIGASVFIPGKLERRLVLKNIDWSLSSGAHCAILGPNGAGKSSLLKLLHGDLWPCSGSIYWYDREGRRQESRIAARELTAIVSPSLQEECQRSPWPMSVKDFLSLSGFGSCGLAGATVFGKTVEIMEQLLFESGLADMPHATLDRLSQGQLRLLLLLRAILARPRLLLLDEYTDGLDAKKRVLALKLLESARDEMCMVFTAHRARAVPDWCEERFYLHQGRRQENCPMPEIAGKKLSFMPPAGASQALFALSNVTVYIDRQKILEKISWQCGVGEHWLIGGDNGSGKSTFLRLLAGDEFAALGGEIRRWNPARGRWIKSLAEARARFMLVSDLMQIRNDYPLTSLELLCTAYDNSTGLHREMSLEEKEGALAMLEEDFPEEDICSFANEDIRRLSTGQLRRLYLARAMLRKPAALLLDEPLNGLDGVSRERFLASLSRLAASGSGGPTIIMVSHYEEDTPSFIGRQARLEQGRLKIVI